MAQEGGRTGVLGGDEWVRKGRVGRMEERRGKNREEERKGLRRKGKE